MDRIHGHMPRHYHAQRETHHEPQKTDKPKVVAVFRANISPNVEIQRRIQEAQVRLNERPDEG